MRDLDNAHYRHTSKGVEPVIQIPIDGASALDWIPDREELVVVCKAGTLAVVDPIMGTRTVLEDLTEPAAVAVSPDGQQVAVVERGAAVVVYQLDTGGVLGRVEVDWLVDLSVAWWRGGVVACGEGLDRRELLILDEDLQVRARGQLPPGVVVGVSERRALLLGRTSHRGAEIVPLNQKLRGQREATRHRLRFGPGGVLVGVADGGVALWRSHGAQPSTIRCFGVSCAALDPSRTMLAIGTKQGRVAITPIDAGAVERSHPAPKGGHDAPVRDMAFSSKGRWLATAGRSCWIWSW